MIARVEGTVIGIADMTAVGPTFDELYEQLWWPMLRLATGLVDEVSVAEDVVQDAFAATYRRWEAIRDRQAAAGYLRTAVVNGSRSVLRGRITERKHLRFVADEPVDAADRSVLRIAERERVLHAMSTLQIASEGCSPCATSLNYLTATSRKRPACPRAGCGPLPVARTPHCA